MKNKIILIVVYLLSINVLHASEERIIKGIAPSGTEYPETRLKAHIRAPVNKGPHGLKEYCYKTNIYIVYSTNLLGHGYELSKEQPRKLKCIKTNKRIIGKNKLGLYIGMPRLEVEKLLKVKNIKNKQPIIWQKELVKNGVRYDLQTYLEVFFIENKLAWLSVFTTETT